MPSRLRRRIDALAAMVVPALWQESVNSIGADVIVTLAQACRDGERVRLAYTARSGEVSTREVDPHRLVLTG
jgi:predicted DNA-binding transcriptional regulator YafY